MNTSISLIVTIVRKGWGSTVLQASVKAGARGGTVLSGRGAGIHEASRLFGTPIEPEKEIVLTMINADQVDAVLSKIVEVAGLDKVGHGIAFVLPVDRVVGAAQFMKAALKPSEG